MTRTFLQQTVTKTADYDGAQIDVSALVGDWTLFLQMFAATLPSSMRFTFQISLDGFSTLLEGPTLSLAACSAGSGPRRFTFNKQDFSALQLGTANATMRLSVRDLTGKGGSITYSSWIENSGL